MESYNQDIIMEESYVEEKKTPIFGIISMILGIVGCLMIGCCCCCGSMSGIIAILFCLVQMAFAIAAIVFAVIDRKKMGKFSGFAIAGLIFGIFNAVISLVSIVIFILGAVGLVSLGFLSEMQNAYGINNYGGYY